MNPATVVTILLLHGGGFSGGSTAEVQPLVPALQSAGYNVVVVDYLKDNPNGNVLGEIATVRRYAQDAERNGPVIAYGVSAGGTLAAALAAKGEVAGAVVAGGPTNLLTWIGLSPIPTPGFWAGLGMDDAQRREASPYYRLDGHQSPELLLYGDIDPIVPIDQGLNYDRAAKQGQPDTTFTLMLASPHAYWDPYRAQALQWIQARWPAGAATAAARTKGSVRVTSTMRSVKQSRAAEHKRRRRT
jgi:acetyl esterase/lipase